MLPVNSHAAEEISTDLWSHGEEERPWPQTAPARTMASDPCDPELIRTQRLIHRDPCTLGWSSAPVSVGATQTHK